MKAIMVMFDTLNRRYLPPYGADWVHAPNFSRLADSTVTFDNAYVGSMPCMPARRDMMTGRYNFLHRSWGPLEPYDAAFPEILKHHGVYTHLVTDHQHYWEDGGATYHSRFNSYEFIRGQEGDAWKPAVGTSISGSLADQDLINRSYTQDEDEFPQAQTFSLGLDFIKNNYKADNWYLQIETFDPHEPFRAPDRFRKLYSEVPSQLKFEWPDYGPANESFDHIQQVRYEYAALLSMCDSYLGKVLDLMDNLNLWEDTLLIVGTDHGFLLGEHGAWAKIVHPFYNEVAHIPLFMWDPRTKQRAQRRTSLVQLVDLAPTILEYFGSEIPSDLINGRSLLHTIADDKAVRSHALFGMHGAHVNITDGRYVYMRGPAQGNQPLYNYTLMPTHMRRLFSVEELRTATLAGPFRFSKGVPLLKVPGSGDDLVCYNLDTMLFDLKSDPQQLRPYRDDDIERDLMEKMTKMMIDCDAPNEQYERLGLTDLVP